MTTTRYPGEKCWLSSERVGFDEIVRDLDEARVKIEDASRRRDEALSRAKDEADKVARLVSAVIDGADVPAQAAADWIIKFLPFAELAALRLNALETKDFRVSSKGWQITPDLTADGNPVWVNEEGDVWEIILDSGATRQLFTFEAALRETAKAGKQMPTERQWYGLLKKAGDWWLKTFPGYVVSEGGWARDELQLGTAGELRLNLRTAAEWLPTLPDSGRQAGFYWANPESGQPEMPGFVVVNEDATLLYRPGYGRSSRGRKSVGMSVRCLKSPPDEVSLEGLVLKVQLISMCQFGRAPERYAERTNRREGAVAFLRRVYGKYLVKGREKMNPYYL